MAALEVRLMLDKAFVEPTVEPNVMTPDPELIINAVPVELELTITVPEAPAVAAEVLLATPDRDG